MVEKQDLVIVIPTFNEKGNVNLLVKGIFKANRQSKVVFVDDNSPDGTGEILDSLAFKYNGRVFVIHRKSKHRSIGRSYVEGFLYALRKFKSGLFMSMDADLSHDPAAIPEFIKAIKGHDLILGSRYIPGGGTSFSLDRKIMSKGANWLAIKLLKLPVHDTTGAYRLYRREVLENIGLKNIKSDGYSLFEEFIFIANSKGFRIKEVPIFFRDREHGKSKLGKKELIRFFLTLMRLRFSHDMRRG
jgi:dolichol-phosphate mannosyltransferase